MFYKIATFTLFLIVCNAQEHLTCLRTDHAPTPTRTPTKIQQGPPGKRGAVRAKGSIGEKGSKGEAGIPDNSLIQQLKDDINSLRQQIQNDKAKANKELLQGYKSLGSGWVTVFNGYQYKKTPGKQSWEASRKICQRWGGDLAVFGIRNMMTRRILERALNAFKTHIWIGLNDIAKEGNWAWINGEIVAKALWAPDEPSNYRNNEDCGVIVYLEIPQRGIHDLHCSAKIEALCEKTISF